MKAIILLMLLSIGFYQNDIIDETFLFTQFSNYETAIKTSKKNKKLTLLYFSAYNSVPCEMMKETTFSDPTVKSILNQKFFSFIAIVDDKTPLPISQQYFSSISKKRILTVGQKFNEIQNGKFKMNAQPYFVIIDGKEKVIAQIIGLTNKKDFLKFLNTKIK